MRDSSRGGLLTQAAVLTVSSSPRTPRPAFRGKRIGFRLVERIVEEARRVGYSRMCLDTLPLMKKAISLYEHFHFKEIGPYKKDPIPGARYMGLEL